MTRWQIVAAIILGGCLLALSRAGGRVCAGCKLDLCVRQSESRRALGNRTDPRQADQSWVRYVAADGRCMHLAAGSMVRVLNRDGDLANIPGDRGPAGGSAWVLARDVTPIAPTGAHSEFLPDRYALSVSRSVVPG